MRKNDFLKIFYKFAVLGIFLVCQTLQGWAQSCDYVAPIQIHYLPIAEGQIHDFFTSVFTGYENCQKVGFSEINPNPNHRSIESSRYISTIDYPMNGYFSIGVIATNTVNYYNHWEDGFETDIENPIQATIKIWNDGDLTNGVAPSYPVDLATQGDGVILQSTLKGIPNPANTVVDGWDKIGLSHTVTIKHLYYPTNLRAMPYPIIADEDYPINCISQFGQFAIIKNIS